jgi:hypothetical protein
MDSVDGGISSTGGPHLNVIPFMAFLGDPRTNLLVSSSRSVNSTTAFFLVDDELPYLGISSVLSNTEDTGPTMDRVVVLEFGHLIQKVPL